MTTLETLELLCQRFPTCFAMLESKRRPLKLRIHDDILAALGDRIDPAQLSQALRHYTSNLRYRMMQTAGSPRIDLQGNPAGTVSEANAASAARDVAGRAAKRQQAMRKPAPPEPPKRLSLADLRAAAKLRKERA